jgi:hypothetical protein
VTSPDNIANDVRIQREVTVALKKESVKVTSLENIAKGVRLQREVTVAPQKRNAKGDLP